MNVPALYAMFMVGLIFGGAPWVLDAKSRAWKIAGTSWLIFWCGPGLAYLWISGVFG